ncbi:MAG: ATP-binding protein [Nanoarchaeota archaeon]|nr:ATP-binding protein [Nanoarchaeota archaeon]
MISTKEKLTGLFYEFKELELETGIERAIASNIKEFLNKRHILAITGVRRSGKTTIMHQLMDYLIKSNIPKENIIYFNFDNKKLYPLNGDELDIFLDTYMEEFSVSKKHKLYLFLDEIQNIPNWERWIKGIYDTKTNIKFIISGSSATLLSSELSTLLTGRNLKFEVFPFSFFEYLKYKKLAYQSLNELKFSSKKIPLKKLFKEYIEYGGFPEVFDYKKKKYLLQSYYEDIILKDVVKRFEIESSKTIEDLASVLMANISNLISYNKLKDTLDSSVNTVKNYMKYLETAYLFFEMNIFSYSMKKQIVNQRKVYCIDTGLRNVVSFRFSEDIGRIVENIVFIELKRRDKEIYYWKDKNEVDFIVKEGLKPKQLIQVCWDVSDKKTKQREIDGLLEAMKKFKLRKGLIITEDYEKEEKVDNKTIKYIPLWKWLLE